jgi:hypothetical protein
MTKQKKNLTETTLLCTVLTKTILLNTCYTVDITDIALCKPLH